MMKHMRSGGYSMVWACALALCLGCEEGVLGTGSSSSGHRGQCNAMWDAVCDRQAECGDSEHEVAICRHEGAALCETVTGIAPGKSPEACVIAIENLPCDTPEHEFDDRASACKGVYVVQ